MPYTQEQLDAMYEELPNDVKDAMSSVDTVYVLAGIQKKYGLHIDQAGELSTDAALLMMGAMKPQEFVRQVETNARIPRETAQKIAAEVNEKIFRPVRESLMGIHKMKDTEASIQPVVENSSLPAGEIPEEHSIKDNAKNKTEEISPDRTGIKDIPPKPAAPDPYREAV